MALSSALGVVGTGGMGWSMDWARGDGDNVTDSVGALWLGRAIDRLLLLLAPGFDPTGIWAKPLQDQIGWSLARRYSTLAARG